MLCGNEILKCVTYSSGGDLFLFSTVTWWCSGRALDSWSRGRGFDSDRGIIQATTLGKLFRPNVPLFTKQSWYLARAFMLKAPYCWQRHRVQWTRGYCRAVLRWFTNCIEPRYKSSALPFLERWIDARLDKQSWHVGVRCTLSKKSTTVSCWIHQLCVLVGSSQVVGLTIKAVESSTPGWALLSHLGQLSLLSLPGR